MYATIFVFSLLFSKMICQDIRIIFYLIKRIVFCHFTQVSLSQCVDDDDDDDETLLSENKHSLDKMIHCFIFQSLLIIKRITNINPFPFSLQTVKIQNVDVQKK